ncbi:hypothetical protein Tco_1321814 [Tanacetum coccineum]
MDITSPSSSLEQINFVLEDWGTNPSDSSIEFSFRTCSVVMEANGLSSPELSSSRSTSGVTKIVLLGLKAIPLTSRFIGTRGYVVSEQDELPSSVRLDFRARLDGGRMYSGHLETMRLP